VLYLGTSGFSYSDWLGNFYPRGLLRGDWLRFYAKEFNALELNSTYYAIPRLSIIESMVNKTGEGFMFSVKANQDMTHQRLNDKSMFEAFVNMLQPFTDAGKLGCVLAQFPFSFSAVGDNFNYLELFRERLRDLPLVVEFRNVQWLKPDIFDWLRKHNLGFCCVDEPQLPKLLPPVAEATTSIAYVRFHGRNSDKWWQHQHAYERYDYSYSEEELKEWVPRINKLNAMAEKTFIFANNHWRSQSVSTIRQLRMMVD